MKVIAAALLLFASSAADALAWGFEGHHIAADIAEQFLEPGTADRCASC